MTIYPERADWKYTCRGNKGMLLTWNKPSFPVTEYVIYRTGVPNIGAKELYSENLPERVTKFVVKADTCEVLDDSVTKDCRFIVLALGPDGKYVAVSNL